MTPSWSSASRDFHLQPRIWSGSPSSHPRWSQLQKRALRPEYRSLFPRPPPDGVHTLISKTLITRCVPGVESGHQFLENAQGPGLAGRGGEGKRYRGGPLWSSLTLCPPQL